MNKPSQEAFMTIQEAADKWKLSERRVRLLCAHGRIAGVWREGRAYFMPKDAIRPADQRRMRGVSVPKKYAAAFARVDALKDEIARRRPLTLGELRALQENFIVEYTYHSNAIEGSTLTLRETSLVLEGMTIDQKPLKEHLEAIGHRDAFLHVQHLLAADAQLSERAIKEIHSLVLMDSPEDKGTYRNIPVKIMGAVHEPPQPWLVPVQMERLLADHAKSKRHILEEAALFHLRFEGIHPFIDGNGRAGRLVLNLMLMQQGYLPVNVKYSDRKRYYSCFDSYYRDNTATPMVTLLTEYQEERLRAYLKILSGDVTVSDG